MQTPDIEKEWRDFAAHVLPADAPEVQRREMRRAFIAGISCGCNMIDAIARADLPELEEGRVLQSLSDQLTRITAGIIAGRD